MIAVSITSPEAIMQSQNTPPKKQPQSVPKAYNTWELPTGLISDYIKLVDQVRQSKK
jgi:hypothetical protein